MDITNDKDENEDELLAKVLETVSPKEDITADGFNTAIDESSEKYLKNPLLLGPVIRCVFKFLNIKDIKNCRLVAWEWGSIGKLELYSRSKIRFFTSDSGRRPADFKSCFLDSAILFGAFEIRNSTAIEELTKFFGEQQQSLKELTFQTNYSEEEILMKIDIGCWIAKSPMVKTDVKYMTKLSLEGYGFGTLLEIPPLHMIAHIKDLTLSNCHINIETGIRICPIKLKLANATFIRDGLKLDRVPLYDIVDLRRAKEVALKLRCSNFFIYGGPEEPTVYVVDLSGRVTLDSLILDISCEILNGGTSQWTLGHLATNYIPYSLNNQMNIKELSVSHACPMDLFTLPNTIQKLALYVEDGPPVIGCSQKLTLPNLQYLHIAGAGDFMPTATNCSLLSHFGNSPKLTNLKINRCGEIEMKSIWMPRTVQTLTLEYSTIKWLDYSYWNLKKIVCLGRCLSTYELTKARILVDAFHLVIKGRWELAVDQNLVEVLEYRKKLRFVNPFYIGKLRWDQEKLENSLLNGHVDVKSSFYVFENGKKGRAISETEFYDLIPEHLHLQHELFSVWPL